MSTLAVFPETPGATFTEKQELSSVDALATGYAQSKWVAETLIQQARARGIPVAIYRPGAVTGDSRTGVCRPDDAVWRMLKSAITLGMAPQIHTEIYGAPADYVCRAIVALASSGAHNGTYHLNAGECRSWQSVLELVRSRGYVLEPTEYHVWRDEVMRRAEADELHDAMAPLVLLMDRENQAAPTTFDRTSARTALAGSPIECRRLDDQLLLAYLEHFIDTGFLPRPPAQTGVDDRSQPYQPHRAQNG